MPILPHHIRMKSFLPLILNGFSENYRICSLFCYLIYFAILIYYLHRDKLWWLYKNTVLEATP